jgi:protein SCO1/2
VRTLLPLVFLVLLASTPAPDRHQQATAADVGVDERLGALIPGDIVLRREDGSPVNLRDLADRPTIIAPVYFHCQHVCPTLLMGLATALGKLEIVAPGKDFQVVALSFDDRDTPAIAREKKPNYLAAIKRPFPPEAWSFLTGDQRDIRKFTDAVGFRFQRDGMDFSHPVTLIVLAPGGKVVRYLYGTTFLPFQVTMAVTEAARGTVGSPAGRVLTYCFSYDAQKGSYVFNILKVVGTVMILTVLSFFIYLMVTGRRAKP